MESLTSTILASASIPSIQTAIRSSTSEEMATAWAEPTVPAIVEDPVQTLTSIVNSMSPLPPAPSSSSASEPMATAWSKSHVLSVLDDQNNPSGNRSGLTALLVGMGISFLLLGLVGWNILRNRKKNAAIDAENQRKATLEKRLRVDTSYRSRSGSNSTVSSYNSDKTLVSPSVSSLPYSHRNGRRSSQSSSSRRPSDAADSYTAPPHSQRRSSSVAPNSYRRSSLSPSRETSASRESSAYIPRYSDSPRPKRGSSPSVRFAL